MIRNVLASLALLVLTVVPAFPGESSPGPEAVVQGFTDAWNRHDMNALASLYADDADFVNVIGLWWHGRDQIRAEHVTLHEGRMKQTTLRAEAPVIRRVSPDVAIAHVKWELRGDEGAEGWKIGEVRKGILTHVLVRSGGAWRIVSTQNTDVLDLPNN